MPQSFRTIYTVRIIYLYAHMYIERKLDSLFETFNYVNSCVSIGCRATGNLNLARTKDKLTEFRRNVAVAR